MIFYAGATALIFLLFVLPAFRSFRREETEARELLAAAVAAGRNEPVTIVPYIDPTRCMGSGTCVKVCPEGDVLQVIDGRATLVNAASCVGHGACAAACPVDAIELRFGSERRGVDIPAVSAKFESSVDGLYIAGELGGMGLIGNAVRQGSEAVAYLCKRQPKGTFDYDLVIVGAGAAGIGASLTAKANQLSHVILEQDVFGGALRRFPRKKIVMTHGLRLPGRKPVPASTLSKEELITLFEGVIRDEALPLTENERVTQVRRHGDGFEVITDLRTLTAGRVLLAIGRGGTPRTLGVPGEDLEKVAYRLLDAETIQHSHILVVGAGDSAIEAACSLAESPGNRVSLAVRGDVVNRPKPKNIAKLNDKVAKGLVQLRLETSMKSIAPDRVVLNTPAGDETVANDYVFIFAGGVLPTKFLMESGISVERHYGGRVETLT